MTVQLRGAATGSLFTAHDARYQAAKQLTGGTLIDNDGDPSQFSRRTMTAAGTTSIAGEFFIDLNWRAVALRWAYCAEAAAEGGIQFQVRYGLVYPLLGQQATGIGLTTIPIAPVQKDMPAGGSAYELPDETSEILTPPDGFLGTSPVMTYSIDRLGDDGDDDFDQDIGLFLATITRVD